ncbi:MAG TPA: glycosyltransferase, partial [Candidatus Limnocylindrales bacterium]|nr:glycosyltransferase [Candidatus Limnocylindrales bacterium]
MSRTQARPSLTIVIPAFNEAHRIGPALDELFDYLRGRQAPRANGMPVGELGDEWSIIVVDDGSTDGT